MLDERRDEIGGTAARAMVITHVGDEWRAIDRQMRRLAKRRAALDAEEAQLLIAARRAEVHVHLGYGSFVEYLERVCGYAPNTARERMRVAEALEELPVLRGALAAGEVSFSAVRELTRVAQPHTEEDWLLATQGCTAREIEDAVRGHAPGDMPDDRPDPALETRKVLVEMTTDVYALFLATRRAFDRATAEPITDSDFMREACELMQHAIGMRLDAAIADDTCADDAGADGTRTDTEDCAGTRQPPTGSNRPRYQIAVSLCSECNRGWHETGSKSIELSAAAVERARCDAIELGNVDGNTPDKTSRTIPAPIRRAVLARDHHRCTVPGCRSAHYVDLHHLTPWAAGGAHDMTNLVTLCSRHHSAAHMGRIHIEGTPGALRVTHADGRPYGMPPPAITTATSSRIATATSSRIATATSSRIATATSSRIATATSSRIATATSSRIATTTNPRNANSSSSRTATTTSSRIATTTSSRIATTTVPATTTAIPAPAQAATRTCHTDRAPLQGTARDAHLALVAMGFKKPEADFAVRAAITHVGDDTPLEPLLRAALRHCPGPRA